MAKKILTILICFIFLQPISAYAFIDLKLTEEPQTAIEEKSLWDTYSEISNIEHQIYELELDIKFLKEPNSTSLKEQLDEKTSEKEKLIKSINDSEEDISERIAEIDLEIEDLQKKIEENDKTTKEELNQKESELENKLKLLEKTKEIAKEKRYELIKKMAIYISLIFLTILIGQLAKRTLKNNKNFSQTKKDMLSRFIHTTEIIIISLILLSLLFSRFATLIPILALVGTGLAFAIRDVILSLLAWFFIGTKKRFKLNDLIEIGGARGRVFHIDLLHTTLKETGENGPTGRIISFPNKKIFEENLHNFSSMYQFIWIIMDFYLEKNSAIREARKKMLESIQEVAKDDISEIQKNLPSLAKQFGLNEETAEPQIYLNIEEKGIHVKVKVLARLSNRHDLKTKITETFLEKIKDAPNVNLRFLMM